MENSRAKLRTKLLEILSSVDSSYSTGHLYFRQPSKKLNYPCIVYKLEAPSIRYANNGRYIIKDRYSVTVIDTDEDSQIAAGIAELRYCKMDTTFETDGLNHTVYTIYV